MATRDFLDRAIHNLDSGDVDSDGDEAQGLPVQKLVGALYLAALGSLTERQMRTIFGVKAGEESSLTTILTKINRAEYVTGGTKLENVAFVSAWLELGEHDLATRSDIATALGL